MAHPCSSDIGFTSQPFGKDSTITFLKQTNSSFPLMDISPSPYGENKTKQNTPWNLKEEDKEGRSVTDCCLMQTWGQLTTLPKYEQEWKLCFSFFLFKERSIGWFVSTAKLTSNRWYWYNYENHRTHSSSKLIKEVSKKEMIFVCSLEER